MEIAGLLITMGLVTSLLGLYLKFLSESRIGPEPGLSDTWKVEAERYKAGVGRHSRAVIGVGLTAAALGAVIAVVSLL